MMLMTSLQTIAPSQFDELFVNDIPMMDVRAPIEFTKGAFPSATNLPILDDDERHQVGICYKESGAEAATALGHQLLAGAKRRERLRTWEDFHAGADNAVLYCFRGGDRSRIACQWLHDEGVSVPRVLGGYKALRQHLLKIYEALPSLMLVSGKTGSGKTAFLSHFAHAIDLEAHANHRGSAFGGHLSPQPSQINFENHTAVSFLKLQASPEVLLEDEGRLIGRISLPLPLQEKMKASPILLIEEPAAERAERIYQEYVVEQWGHYQAHFDVEPDVQFRHYLLSAIDAIRKRLGGAAHQRIRQQIIEADDHHCRTGSLDLHRQWVTALLVDYYDPMYDYQMTKKTERIKARDTRRGLVEWYTHELEKRS